MLVRQEPPELAFDITKASPMMKKRQSDPPQSPTNHAVTEHPSPVSANTDNVDTDASPLSYRHQALRARPAAHSVLCASIAPLVERIRLCGSIEQVITERDSQTWKASEMESIHDISQEKILGNESIQKALEMRADNDGVAGHGIWCAPSSVPTAEISHSLLASTIEKNQTESTATMSTRSFSERPSTSRHRRKRSGVSLLDVEDPPQDIHLNSIEKNSSPVSASSSVSFGFFDFVHNEEEDPIPEKDNSHTPHEFEGIPVSPNVQSSQRFMSDTENTTPLMQFPLSPELKGVYSNYRLREDLIDDVLKNMDVTLSSACSNGDIVNSCSEPSASSICVRGEAYAENNLKVPSQPAMFALLGVDSFVRSKNESPGDTLVCSDKEFSYFNRLQSVCKKSNVAMPFLLIYNFNLPWGNLIAYMYRPDGSNGRAFNDGLKDDPSERLWKKFLEGSPDFRNERLKLIPQICEGPWMIKRLVGSKPVIIGRKLPVSYHGSVEDNYLEICLDVTGGGAIETQIANTVAGRADAVTVDIAFVIEGKEESELPEQVLGVWRLHHVAMKKAWNGSDWIEEVRRRETERD